MIYVVQTDDNLGADGLDGRLFIDLRHVQSLSDVAEALYIEVGLVAEDD